jgi:hypothetical protein
MTKLIGVAALVEAVTGALLMIDPAIVARLLLGDTLSGTGTAVGRIAGLALLALGLACWPQRQRACATRPAVFALFTYNLLITAYLAWLGFGGPPAGNLLWPAAGIHAILTFLIAHGWFQEQRTQKSKIASRQGS